MNKKIVLGILLISFFLMGIWLTKKYYAWKEVQTQEQSQVLLERIKSVYKLTTVEGYFSEIYDYKDYWGYDFGPFRKKALVRVKAKVAAGYDLSNWDIKVNTTEKKIILTQLPTPELLYIDHDIDYYDLTEGTFNTFTTKDYNQLNANAKEYIAKKARESDLIVNAKRKGEETLNMVRFMVESADWQLEITSNKIKHPKIEQLIQ